MSVIGWVGAIIALSVLIIVHESGHYLVAKWCKMRVDRFSLGFGPALLGWRRKGTLFQIAPIPFGGFVEIRGMNIAEDVDPHDRYAYPNRPVWQRFLTIFAGPGTNYLFAIFLAFLLYSIAGVSTGRTWYSVSEVNPDYDAHGKLMPGDDIVAVKLSDDAARIPIARGVPGARGLGEVVQDSKGNELEIFVSRDGQELSFKITPKPDQPPEENSDSADKSEGGSPASGAQGADSSSDSAKPAEPAPPRYLIGIVMEIHRERAPVGILASLGYAFRYPIDETVRIVGELKKIITGEVEGELTGPVGITEVIKDSLQIGWIYAIQLLMMLNVYLGLFNLLPLPALDGGRLAFLVYEMATRKRANPKVEAPVHMVGIMILMVVLVVVTFKDCARLFS